jgi:NADH:ubiquinone oxidoreductase subunit 5 (subunit L)/multisubunit Na+/H+ antiporter MnhA subunit
VNRFGTTDLSEILSQLFLLSFEYVVFSNIGLVVNFAGMSAFCLSFALLLKSAQFFFYPWLLDAMEAPVPISAQLHSSTLVIIGFYFYLRFQNLFILAPAVSNMLLLFGVGTVVGASVLGFFQEDGKKLLACSTASQLGYAVTGLGMFFFEESLVLMTFCCCNKAFTFI